MTKIMSAAGALFLGVALAATAQANSTMRQSANPTDNTQQTAQTGTSAAPQVTKQRTTRTASKQMTARRHVAAKRSGKLTLAKATKRSRLQQTARMHRRGQRGEQPSTAVGSSTMPSTNPMMNTPPATNAPIAGSGSSLPSQDQTTSPQNQNLQNPNLQNPNNPSTIR